MNTVVGHIGARIVVNNRRAVQSGVICTVDSRKMQSVRGGMKGASKLY